MHCSAPIGEVYIFVKIFNKRNIIIAFNYNYLKRTYEKLKETDHAAAAYCDYLRESSSNGTNDMDDSHGQAYLYLANYYLNKGPQCLDTAREYAHKCVEYPSVIIYTDYV